MSTESDENTVESSAAEPIETTPDAAAGLAEQAMEVTQPAPQELPTQEMPAPNVPEAVEPEMVAVLPTANQESEEAPSPANPKKQRRKNSRKPRKNTPTLRHVTARFAACGRCSYFWAGYRVLQGMDELEMAVAQSKAGWLELIWNTQMPDLIYKTYGVRLDITHFHYEGCCKECRRHFIYEAADNEADADAFRIEISPWMAK